jgi:hypothetical protein
VYLGHVGIALGAKGLRPRIVLLALLLATYAPDWVDAGLCVVGAYDPRGMMSHSFLAASLLAALALAAYSLAARSISGGLIVAMVVVSHMALDWLTGLKPTWPGGPTIGLGLYARPALNMVVEVIVLAIGVILYRRSLPNRTNGWFDAAVMLGALVFMQGAVTVLRALTVALPKC